MPPVAQVLLEPNSTPTQHLSHPLPGTGTCRAGPGEAPWAGLGPECPAQAPGSVEFPGSPFSPDTYLVLAIPAHDQVVPVSAS